MKLYSSVQQNHQVTARSTGYPDGSFSLKLFSSTLHQKSYLSVDHITDKNFKKLFKTFWEGQGVPGKKGIQSLEGYPEGLDLENWECQGVNRDGVHFVGGGDWQDETAFCVGLDGRTLKVVSKYEKLGKDAPLTLDQWLYNDYEPDNDK